MRKGMIENGETRGESAPNIFDQLTSETTLSHKFDYPLNVIGHDGVQLVSER